MKRVLRSASLLGVVALVLAPAANAGVLDELRGSIASLWGQKARKHTVAQAARAQVSHKSQQVEMLHDRLEETQQLLQTATDNYYNYFRQMRRTEAKIRDTREQIRLTTVRYTDHKARFGARLAAIQLHGNPNFLPLALSAQSLSDLSRRIDVFQTLMRHDADLQRDLKSDHEDLNQAHNALMAQWNERNQLQKQANRERERVVYAQQRERVFWRQLNTSRQALAQYAAAQEQSSREIAGMINDLESRKSQIISAYEAQKARERERQNEQRAWAAALERRDRRRYARSFNSTRTSRYAARRYAPQVPLGRRYAPQVEVGPRYAPRVELSSYSLPRGGYRQAGFAFPARGRLSSRFGMRVHPITHRYKLHTGDDIAAPEGSPILAARGGRVLWAGWKKAYGNTVIVDVGGGKTILYGHASRLNVSAGQPVSAGQQIGNVGSTGWSTGPHLHFEVRQNGRPIDPTAMLRGH